MVSNYILQLRGLDFYGFHGCVDEERKVGHRYLVDADCHISSETPITDDVEGLVNYAELASAILTFAQNTNCWSIEFLTREIGERILELFLDIQSIDITVTMPLPAAPVMVQSIAVKMTIGRD